MSAGAPLLGHPVTLAAGAALIGLLGSLVLRAELWRGCIPDGPPRREVLGWTAAGFALNQLVGFRAGDVLRVALARRHCGVLPAAASVALFRLLELAALVLCAALFLADRFSAGAGAWLAFAGLVAGLLLLSPIARSVRHRGRAVLEPLIALRPLTLARLLALALLAVAAEASSFVGVAHALGHPVGLLEAIFLLALCGAGQLVSLTPANLGTWEASLAGGLAGLGYSGAVLWTLPVWTHALRVGLALVLWPFGVGNWLWVPGGNRWIKIRS